MVLENDAAGRQKGKKGDEYDSHEGDERNPIDSPVMCVHHVGFARMQAVSTRLLAILQVFAAADPDEGGNPAKFESVVMGSLPSRQRLSRCHVFPDANTQLRRKQHQENEGAGEGYRGNGPYSFGILPTTGAKPFNDQTAIQTKHATGVMSKTSIKSMPAPKFAIIANIDLITSRCV